MDIDDEISKLRNRLCNRLHMAEIRETIADVHADKSGTLREAIFALTGDKDNRVAYNALWCLSHLSRNHTGWLRTKHDEMIDHVLVSNHDGHIRLLLTVLERTYDPEKSLRTDFLDFCFESINSTMPCGHRMLCMKLAYAQCCHIPELLSEFRQVLELTEYGPVSPGITSARRNILRRMDREDRHVTRQSM